MSVNYGMLALSGVANRSVHAGEESKNDIMT
jgi:hypothetical protein